MTNFVVNLTVDNVIDALMDFIKPFMPQGADIVRGQTNRVAQPQNPCVILTELIEYDLSIPSEDHNPVNQTDNIRGHTRIDIQVDFYGEDAGDYCKAVKQAFRSPYAFGQFPDGIKPLYTDDGRQSPLITGEEQYESRWTLTAFLQYNPVVTVPQQSATVLTPTIKTPVDFPIT